MFVIAGFSVSYKDSGYSWGPPRWDRGHLARWGALTLPPFLLCLPLVLVRLLLRGNLLLNTRLKSIGPSHSGLTGTRRLLCYRWGIGGSEGGGYLPGSQRSLGTWQNRDSAPCLSGFRAHGFFPVLAASQSDRIPVPIKSSSKPELCRNQMGHVSRAWIPCY